MKAQFSRPVNFAKSYHLFTPLPRFSRYPLVCFGRIMTFNCPGAMGFVQSSRRSDYDCWIMAKLLTVQLICLSVIPLDRQMRILAGTVNNRGLESALTWPAIQYKSIFTEAVDHMIGSTGADLP